MKYLIRHDHRNRPNGKAHIVSGADTVCRQWSTGGMNRKRNWKISDTPKGQAICSMCDHVASRQRWSHTTEALNLEEAEQLELVSMARQRQ